MSQDINGPHTESNEVGPATEQIVSVNSRGANSNDGARKLLFVGLVAVVLVLGGLFGLNKWRASQKAKESATVVNKEENKPALVSQRRTFSEEPPPPTPTQKAQAPLRVFGQGGTGSAPVTDNAGSPCAVGDPGQPVLGPDGKQVMTPTGQGMRVCKSGQVYVPAVQAQPGETVAPVRPVGVTPAGGQPAAPSGMPAPSRYAGDALVPSPMNVGGAQSASQAKTDAVANSASTLIDKLLGSQGQAGKGLAANPYAALNGGAGNGPASPDSQTAPVGNLLNNSVTPPVSASMIGDRSMILPKGRTIDCSLSTRIINEVSGMATCVITADVFSDNGRVVLIERGSEVTGEYTAAMQQGQRRLFVLWTRVKTQNGVIVNINSPAADGLGTSGLGGYVDNRWFDRIGAAFLLSLVQDAIAYATARDASPGSAQAAQSTTDTGNKMAEKVLESTINIKPTLYKNQGDRAAIFVARDLDFGSVYALKQR